MPNITKNHAITYPNFALNNFTRTQLNLLERVTTFLPLTRQPTALVGEWITSNQSGKNSDPAMKKKQARHQKSAAHIKRALLNRYRTATGE